MSERPKANDLRLLGMVAEKLLPEVVEYCLNGNGMDSAESVRADLLVALKYGETDGYKLARELERRCHWEADAQLVEILNEAEDHHATCYAALVCEWVKSEGITLALPIGASVRVALYMGRNRGTEEHDGIVTVLYAEEARYLVCFPELGHVREGNGTLGHVLDRERVEQA